MQILPPRAPVETGKSGSIDVPDKYLSGMMQHRALMQQEARAVQETAREYQQIQKYIDAIEGSHHPKDRPRWRSRYVDNRIGNARFNDLALLTDIRPRCSVKATSQAFEQQESVIENVMLSEWSRSQMAVSLVGIIDHALLGTGFAKITAFTPGDMKVIGCGLDSVVPIGMQSHIQDSACVQYRAYHMPGYFYRTFGDKAKGIENEAMMNRGQSTIEYQRPLSVPEFSQSTMSPAFRAHFARKQGVRMAVDARIPWIPLEEYWIDDWSVNESNQEILIRNPYLPLNRHNYWYKVKPGQPLWPRKRLVVWGADRLLYDGPSPYWHGQYPFAMLRLNPVCWSMWGLSKYRDLMPLNEAINEIGAGILEMVKKALSPTVVTKDGAISREAWGRFYPDLPSQKLMMTAIGNPSSDIHWQSPPELPSYVAGHLLTYLLPEFERLSGTMDVAAIGRKQQVPGGDTIEQMRDSLQTPMRLEGRFIEAFLTDIGTQSQSNIIQCYTAARRFQRFGPNGVSPWQDFEYNPSDLSPSRLPHYDHWRNFNFLIEPDSALSAAKDRDKLVAAQMFRIGGISIQELHRKTGYTPEQSMKILDEMKAEAREKAMMQAEMAGIAQGIGAGGSLPAPGGQGDGERTLMRLGGRSERQGVGF